MRAGSGLRSWRPGPFLRLAVAAACAWLAVLNVGVARSDAPFALHGTKVEVTIDRCVVDPHGLRTCRGSYRIDSRTVSDQPVLGADAAPVGAVRHATVDRRHPGPARTEDPRAALVEAALFALAGFGLTAVALRGAWRGWTTRRAPAPPSASTPEGPPAPRSEGPPAGGDDPLAWARRRKFGAGR